MKIENLAENKDFIRGRDPIIYIIDAEVTPARGLFYPPTYKTNIITVEEPQKLISLAWKKPGSSNTECVSIYDFEKQKPGLENIKDKEIARKAYELIEEADLVIGHNVRDFDMKILRTRIAYHNFKPPAESKTEDTLKIVQKYFRLEKNTLEYACEFFGIGTKTHRKHADILPGFLQGNPKDISDMKKYNKQDVIINDKLWEKVSPWHTNTFNLNLIGRRGQRCKVCLANGRPGTNFRPRGYSYSAKSHIRREYVCRIDGHRWRGEIVARSPALDPVDKVCERVDEHTI